MHPQGRLFLLLALLGALALLVSDAAAGLASRLARGLALTASTVLCALAKVTSLDSFDMLHYSSLQRNFFYYAIIHLFWIIVNLKNKKMLNNIQLQWYNNNIQLWLKWRWQIMIIYHGREKLFYINIYQ